MRQRKVNYCCNWSFFSQSLAITTPPGLWWGHKDQTHTQSIGQFSTAGSCSILIAVPRSVGILYYCRNTHQGILLFVALLSPRVVWACYTCVHESPYPPGRVSTIYITGNKSMLYYYGEQSCVYPRHKQERWRVERLMYSSMPGVQTCYEYTRAE